MTKSPKNNFKQHRDFLKDNLRLQINFYLTDQNRGVEPPPIQKKPRENQSPILLPRPEKFNDFSGTDLVAAINRRRSHRRFLDRPLTQLEISWLLWATQGIVEEVAPGCALRTVPSAGCRHAFETYLVIRQVAGLQSGLYRFLPLEHAMVFERHIDDLEKTLTSAALGQHFIAMAPVTFVWTVIPYRMEWRYDLAAHRVIAMDVGHLCQNLYLACEAINAGTCAIAAYNQEETDRMLQVDGEDEFTIYMAPVGKIDT